MTIAILVSMFICCLSCGLLVGSFARQDIKAKCQGLYGRAREKYESLYMLDVDKKHLYETTEDTLYSRGIKFRMGSNFSPFDYLVLRLLVGLAVGLFCMILLHPFMILPGTIGGFFLVNLYFRETDISDNGKMMDDIANMYGIVALQLKNSIYLADVIYECAMNVKYRRLKQALLELNLEMKQFSDVKTAADSFRRKFNNEHIDMFAKTIEQAEAAGDAVDLFKDVENQIKGINEALVMRQERKIRNTADVFMFLVFIGALLFLVFIMMNMLSSMSLDF